VTDCRVDAALMMLRVVVILAGYRGLEGRCEDLACSAIVEQGHNGVVLIIASCFCRLNADCREETSSLLLDS
jgi:hypothetical protein